MSLRQKTVAAVVAAGLALSCVAPASAGMPVSPASSNSNTGEKALIGVAILGLIMWLTRDSNKPADAAVTRNGDNTSGSVSLFKF